MSRAVVVARFAWVEYQGFGGSPPSAGSYRNPILPGFYPDPSIERVGNDFYLVNSSFSWFPGLPVWHSRDLVHWRQIGNAIDRADQLDFTSLGMSRGTYAPDIVHRDGRWFIINTCVGCGGNYVITARDPRGPWSKPVWLKEVGGIDPALFFDDDGSAWIVNNDVPAEAPLYDGHRAIWLHHFDADRLQVTGAARMIVDGGVDPVTKPVWIEGPHLFKEGGHYYLMAAEGGTSTQHSEVIFRAERIEGPYRPAPPSVNPILTQRDLPDDRPRPITSTGHADLVELRDGSWWAVFLGTRPYAGDLYNTGRETFLLPVTWHDGWPTILPHRTPVPDMVRRPALPPQRGAAMAADLVKRDDFARASLGPDWLMMRTPQGRWWQSGNGLQLTVRPERIGDGKQPSFIGWRQQHAEATVTTALSFAPRPGEEAGLAAIQNDAFFLTIGLRQQKGRAVVRVARRAGAGDPVEGVTVATLPVAAGPVRLRLQAHGGRYDFAVAQGKEGWRIVARNVDGTGLSTAKAGGFVGTLIGPYAQTSVAAAPAILRD